MYSAAVFHIMHFVDLRLNLAHYPDTAIISNERLNTIVYIIVHAVGQDVKCTKSCGENHAYMCYLLSIRWLLCSCCIYHVPMHWIRVVSVVTNINVGEMHVICRTRTCTCMWHTCVLDGLDRMVLTSGMCTGRFGSYGAYKWHVYWQNSCALW